jgi:hypothetical protein
MTSYDPAADPVHGGGWNSAARWGGWDWREPRYGDFFRTCSFCGCIHPEDLAAETAGTGCGYPDCPAPRDEMARCHFPPPQPLQPEHGEHLFADTGWRASWADRKYGWPHKFYVEGLKPRDPSLLHCAGSSNSTENPGGGDWVHASQLTRQQKRVIKDDGMHSGGKFEGWYLLEPRGTLHAKFYTAHLADPHISQDVKDTIQRVSGLRFTWTDDGRVRWESWPPSAPDSAP